MCLFRGPTITPQIEVGKAPPPMAPTNAQTSDELPTKKELVDPDDQAGLSLAYSAKKASGQGKGGTGANALKIKVNTGGTQTGVGANTGVG